MNPISPLFGRNSNRINQNPVTSVDRWVCIHNKTYFIYICRDSFPGHFILLHFILDLVWYLNRLIQMVFFWFVPLCSLLTVYHCFRGTYCLHLQGLFQVDYEVNGLCSVRRSHGMRGGGWSLVQANRKEHFSGHQRGRLGQERERDEVLFLESAIALRLCCRSPARSL
jgi:hypothetical protein